MTERYSCPDCRTFCIKTPNRVGWVQAFCPRCREYKVIRLPEKPDREAASHLEAAGMR